MEPESPPKVYTPSVPSEDLAEVVRNVLEGTALPPREGGQYLYGLFINVLDAAIIFLWEEFW